MIMVEFPTQAAEAAAELRAPQAELAAPMRTPKESMEQMPQASFTLWVTVFPKHL